MADRPNQCKRNVAVCCAVVFTAAACGGGEPDQVPTSVRTDSAPSTSALPIDGQAEATAQSPQAAALRFVASTDTLLGHSAIGRRQILTALIAPGALPAQEQALADAVERIATTLGVPVERLIWVEAPLTSTVRTVDADRAVVDVWTVSVVGVPGEGSPEQVWRTVHVSLQLFDGRWLVTESPADAGPTPAPNELALQASWDEFQVVAGWQPIVAGVEL